VYITLAGLLAGFTAILWSYFITLFLKLFRK